MLLGWGGWKKNAVAYIFAMECLLGVGARAGGNMAHMGLDLEGTWVSVRSTIPGYVPGKESLVMGNEGRGVWKQVQPNGAPWSRPLRVEAEGTEGARHRFISPRSDGAADVSWVVEIVVVGPATITLKPPHGQVTEFEKRPVAA